MREIALLDELSDEYDRYCPHGGHPDIENERRT